jgi:hypothetical protein
MFRGTAILMIASACLVGCGMAPTYRRHEVPVSATWPTGLTYKDATGKPADKMTADIPWQEFFVDPQLQQLLGFTKTLPPLGTNFSIPPNEAMASSNITTGSPPFTATRS